MVGCIFRRVGHCMWKHVLFVGVLFYDYWRVRGFFSSVIIMRKENAIVLHYFVVVEIYS